MKTNAVCAHGRPVFVVHGAHDGTNPIHRVQKDARKFAETMQLHVLENDTHHVGSVTDEEGWAERLKSLVLRAVEWGQKCPSRGPYKNTSINAALLQNFAKKS